jgi:hypothetical protein
MSDMDVDDIIQQIADILREHLETRPVITTASDIAAPIHPGWVGPISWELAQHLVEACNHDPQKSPPSTRCVSGSPTATRSTGPSK